jgi:hypothetical protein
MSGMYVGSRLLVQWLGRPSLAPRSRSAARLCSVAHLASAQAACSPTTAFSSSSASRRTASASSGGCQRGQPVAQPHRHQRRRLGSRKGPGRGSDPPLDRRFPVSGIVARTLAVLRILRAERSGYERRGNLGPDRFVRLHRRPRRQRRHGLRPSPRGRAPRRRAPAPTAPDPRAPRSAPARPAAPPSCPAPRRRCAQSRPARPGGSPSPLENASQAASSSAVSSSSTSDGASVSGREVAREEPAPAGSSEVEVEVDVDVDPPLARYASSPVTCTSFGLFHGHTSCLMCRLSIIRISLRAVRRLCG